MKRLLVVSAACLLSGVTVAIWLGVHGAAGTVAFAIIYGFISGGLVSLPPVTVAGLSKDQDEYSTRMGMAFTVCSFGALRPSLSILSTRRGVSNNGRREADPSPALPFDKERENRERTRGNAAQSAPALSA